MKIISSNPTPGFQALISNIPVKFFWGVDIGKPPMATSSIDLQIQPFLLGF